MNGTKTIMTSTELAEYAKQHGQFIVNGLDEKLSGQNIQANWLAKWAAYQMSTDPKVLKATMALRTSSMLIVGGIYKYYFNKLGDCTKLSEKEYLSRVAIITNSVIPAVKEFDKCYQVVAKECVKQTICNIPIIPQFLINLWFPSKYKMNFDEIEEHGSNEYHILASLMTEIKEVQTNKLLDVMTPSAIYSVRVDAKTKNCKLFNPQTQEIIGTLPLQAFLKIHHTALEKIREIFSIHFSSFSSPSVEGFICAHTLLKHNIDQVREISFENLRKIT